jgi:hypothetical protein
VQAIPVKVTVEPSYNNGEALWVRSEDQTWWKWYGSRLDACIEAAQLRLANRQELPSGERFTLDVRYSSKENAMADPDELVRFGFGKPPAID